MARITALEARLVRCTTRIAGRPGTRRPPTSRRQHHGPSRARLYARCAEAARWHHTRVALLCSAERCRASGNGHWRMGSCAEQQGHATTTMCGGRYLSSARDACFTWNIARLRQPSLFEQRASCVENHAVWGTDHTGARGSVACEVFHVEHSVSSTAWVQHRVHRYRPPLLAAWCSHACPERGKDSNRVPMVAAGTDRRSMQMQPCASQDAWPRTVRASAPDVSRGTPRADLGLHLCTPVMLALIATSTRKNGRSHQPRPAATARARCAHMPLRHHQRGRSQYEIESAVRMLHG